MSQPTVHGSTTSVYGEFQGAGGLSESSRYQLLGAIGGVAATRSGAELSQGYVVVEGGFIGLSSARVAARHVFYNQSLWDNGSPSGNAADDAAIAPDKRALLPGEQASFWNYTSYSRGLNGIFVDVVDLPDGIDVSDFEFRSGNDNAPVTWAEGPAPLEIAVRRGAGLDGSDRISLIWGGSAVRGKWLQVHLKATEFASVTWPDTFYFGNAVGDTGNNPGNARVDPADQLLVRTNPRNALNPADIDNPYDMNRDGRVDPSDELIARSHQTTVLTELRLIHVPLELDDEWEWLTGLSSVDGSEIANLTEAFASSGIRTTPRAISGPGFVAGKTLKAQVQWLRTPSGLVLEVSVPETIGILYQLESASALQNAPWRGIQAPPVKRLVQNGRAGTLVWTLPVSNIQTAGFFRIRAYPNP
jgi:hypothetical protein